MHRRPRLRGPLLLCAALPILACEPPPPAPADAGPGGCAPPVLCYPGCDGDGCLAGTLDVEACVCRSADGKVIPWPAGDAPVSLVFSPALPAYTGRGSRLVRRVLAVYAGAPDRDVTAQAQVSASPAGLLETVGPGDWRALADGTVTLQATWSGAPGLVASGQTVIRPEEARAVWVTRYGYRTSAADGPADVRRIVDAAADAGFNIVMLQVRAEADAYYASTLEPWSKRLSGTLGADPGWDPLAVGLERAHARGLQLHAYVNVFSGWASASGQIPASAAGAPEHALRAHPEWIESDSAGTQTADGYQWMSPGVEAVRVWNAQVVRELATRYAVDGVHLDRVRYAGSDHGRCAASREAYVARWGADASHWDEFRVEAVNDQVRRIQQALAEARPAALLSAAVWGIYEPLPQRRDDPASPPCGTSRGLAGYFQDSLAWAERGWIDALCPMIYWAEEPDAAQSCTDFGELLGRFLARRGARQIWAGMDVLDRGTGCSGNCAFDWSKLLLRIETARAAGAAGMALFSSQALDQAGGWSLAGAGPFREPAPPPSLSWR